MTVDFDEETVELGLPDGPLDDGEELDPFLGRIGGRPTWLKQCPETEKKLKCQRCDSALYLLLQMDSPLPVNNLYVDRIIYVFICNTRECTESGQPGTVRVIVQCRRATKTAPEIQLESSAHLKGLWDSIMSVGEVTQAVEKVSLGDQNDLGEQQGYYSAEYPVGFPATALRIVNELISTSNVRISKMEVSPSVEDMGGEAWQDETYEKTVITGYDKAFKSFNSRVAHYPRQCVRYAPNGSPLPFCSATPLEVPSCTVCGGSRVFELQLMPAILSCLPTNNETYLKHIPKGQRGKHPLFGDGMEWGTIMVYSCGICQLEADFCQFEGFAIVQIEKEI